MPITSNGKLVIGVLDERGRRIFGSLDERGYVVYATEQTPLPTNPPVVTIDSVNHNKISGQTGINSSTINFRFDTDVTEWVAKLNGVDHTTGVTVDGSISTIVNDSFNRANSTTSLGNAETGQSWVAYGGSVYGIANNKAYQVSGSPDYSFAGINASQSNVILTATISEAYYGTGDLSYLVLRATNATNYVGLAINPFGDYYLFEALDGNYVATYASGVVPTNGDIVKVICDGSLITLNVNGNNILSETITHNQTGTIFGFQGGANPNNKIDSFKIETLVGLGTVSIPNNTNITATIDWNEGLSEGQNRINIYGKNSQGWTLYESSEIIIYKLGARRYGTSIYGKQ